jgi:hypothetical protein
MGHTASSSAGPSRHTRSSTSAVPCSNASPKHAHNQSHFIKSLALAITKEEKQMTLLGTIGTPVIGGAEVIKFIKDYKSLSSHTGTNPAAKDVITRFPYNYSETIEETIKMKNEHLRKDWVQLREELKDTFRCADSVVNI